MKNKIGHLEKELLKVEHKEFYNELFKKGGIINLIPKLQTAWQPITLLKPTILDTTLPGVPNYLNKLLKSGKQIRFTTNGGLPHTWKKIGDNINIYDGKKYKDNVFIGENGWELAPYMITSDAHPRLLNDITVLTQRTITPELRLLMQDYNVSQNEWTNLSNALGKAPTNEQLQTYSNIKQLNRNGELITPEKAIEETVKTSNATNSVRNEMNRVGKAIGKPTTEALAAYLGFKGAKTIGKLLGAVGKVIGSGAATLSNAGRYLFTTPAGLETTFEFLKGMLAAEAASKATNWGINKYDHHYDNLGDAFDKEFFYGRGTEFLGKDNVEFLGDMVSGGVGASALFEAERAASLLPKLLNPKKPLASVDSESFSLDNPVETIPSTEDGNVVGVPHALNTNPNPFTEDLNEVLDQTDGLVFNTYRYLDTASSNYLYFYDINGNIISEGTPHRGRYLHTGLDLDVPVYDLLGHLIRFMNGLNGRLGAVANGNTVVVKGNSLAKTFRENGLIHTTQRYLYDSNGSLISRGDYDPNTGFWSHNNIPSHLEVYDSQGNLLKFQNETQQPNVNFDYLSLHPNEIINGSIYSRNRFFFDEDGKIVSRGIRDPNHSGYYVHHNISENQSYYDIMNERIRILNLKHQIKIDPNTNLIETYGYELRPDNSNTIYKFHQKLDRANPTSVHYIYDNQGSEINLKNTNLSEDQLLSNQYYTSDGKKINWVRRGKVGDGIDSFKAIYDNGYSSQILHFRPEAYIPEEAENLSWFTDVGLPMDILHTTFMDYDGNRAYKNLIELIKRMKHGLAFSEANCSTDSYPLELVSFMRYGRIKQGKVFMVKDKFKGGTEIMRLNTLGKGYLDPNIPKLLFVDKINKHLQQFRQAFGFSMEECPDAVLLGDNIYVPRIGIRKYNLGGSLKKWNF